jgi:hypothetical protein
MRARFAALALIRPCCHSVRLGGILRVCTDYPAQGRRSEPSRKQGKFEPLRRVLNANPAKRWQPSAAVPPC